MKKWEDIFKDRLEGYESMLPTGSLAEFRARRVAGGTVSRQKTFTLAWAVAAAVAAGLAAVLLLRKPTGPEEEIQSVQRPPVVKVQAGDTTDIVSPNATTAQIAQAMAPKVFMQTAMPGEENVRRDSARTDEAAENSGSGGTRYPETNDDVAQDSAEESAMDKTPSPFVWEGTETGTARLSPLAGGLLGTGVLVALAENIRLTDYGSDPPPVLDTEKEDRVVGSSHSFPLKLGLSTRIPLSGNLYCSTGLEYSLYTSEFTWTYSGEKKQKARYLGVPVRMDWVFISGRMLNVYIGGGLEGDWCLGASLDGKKTAKDGFSFSLLGAGGVQMNVNRRLGVYVEPELNWQMPLRARKLETYRSEHPLMFSVATGLRITLGE